VEDGSIPELIAPDLADIPVFARWETFGSYTFEGVLIEKVLFGGMYTHDSIEPERARLVARRFVDAAAPARPHAEFLRLTSPWTPWFWNMLDDTLAITAWGTDDWWLIATRDTD